MKTNPNMLAVRLFEGCQHSPLRWALDMGGKTTLFPFKALSSLHYFMLLSSWLWLSRPLPFLLSVYL